VTAKGAKQLASATENWNRFSEAVQRAMSP